MTIFGQNKAKLRFFSQKEFFKNLPKEKGLAKDVFDRMIKSGLKDNCLSKMDFTFISDKKENLIQLSEYIQAHYNYSVEEIKKKGKIWALNGITNEIPITSNNLLYWVMDMYKRGFEFDSKLEAYGSPFDEKNQIFPIVEPSKEVFYFEKALRCYNEGNLSGAIIFWTLCLSVNPNSEDAYYSRAIVKNELYDSKSALDDYDKAIIINPYYASAILNRGTLKDENSDYQGAIKDYNTVLSLEKVEKTNRQSAYFNRGNTYFNLKKTEEACEDWKKAFELGADYAKEQIEKNCK